MNLLEIPALVTLIIAMAVAARAQEATTPETMETWPSPDKSAAIIQQRIRTLEEDPTAQYALSLQRGHTKLNRLFEFGRSVNVLWAPDARHFAVTDFIGSNISDCYLYNSSNTNKRIEMFDLLPKALRLLDAHIYVTCEHWKDDGKLGVMVKGHTDYAPSRLFERHYVYDPKTRQLVRISASEGPAPD